MFDLPIRKWKTLLYILLSRGSAADKIFVLWTSVVSFLGWTINLMSIYPRTCMLSVLINSITWGKSSYLNDVIRVPRPGTLMMSFLLAPCQMWSQNKTQPWSLAWSAQTGPDPHHQDVTAQWPLKFDHCDLELGMGHLIWLSVVLLILTPSALGYVVIDRDYLAALIRDYIAKRLVVC